MEYKTPVEYLLENSAKTPSKVYLHQPIKRQWKTFTWAEVEDQVRRIANGLIMQGYEPGSRIGILSKNCAEWFIADLAIMMARMISVPIYATASQKTIEHIIEHSELKAIFIGKLDDTLAADAAIKAEVLRIALPYPTVAATAQWQDWLASYTPLSEFTPPTLDDTMTLVYTSGSTGVPKGVVLTFRNLASASHATASQLEARPTDHYLSYLPLAHITERSVIECVSFMVGYEVFFVESLDTFIDDLRYAKPNGFLSVPRLWSKFQAQILHKIPDQKLQTLLGIPLIGRLVAYKIRKQLGLQDAKVFGSGTAPISPSILDWYLKLGIPISEGWGMTETSGLSCGNLPFVKERLGTVGIPVECVEMKLSKDAEILIRGDAVFKGYYLNPQATAEAFVDGWFRTGDCGIQNTDGSFQIVGRIKEQFKTAKGKYVVPVPIESLLFNNHYIEQACVMGSGRKQPIAIIVLNEPGKAKDPAVVKSLEKTLHTVNSKLESHQQLDHLIICSSPWTIENDLLTPTLKIRRNNLEEHYSHLLHRKLDQAVIQEDELL
jgi:long-subunit acyl-CoA synthetase (AMP-forming)